MPEMEKACWKYKNGQVWGPLALKNEILCRSKFFKNKICMKKSNPAAFYIEIL